MVFYIKNSLCALWFQKFYKSQVAFSPSTWEGELS